MAAKSFAATFSATFRVTVVRKIVMALTGLFLVLFVIVHMLGNFTFLVGPEAFNSYTYKLKSLGPLLYFVEIVLALAFLFHAWNAVRVWWGNNKARPVAYRKTATSGNPSKQTISSKTMIWTGSIILVFTIIHVLTFKYGPAEAEGYIMMVNGTEMRDLYRLVLEVFQSPVYAFGYIAVMVLLGFHLRHGFWSAFQSLGANHPRYSPLIYTIGLIIGAALAVGFTIVPIVVYFNLV